jgi:hypothetical protein
MLVVAKWRSRPQSSVICYLSSVLCHLDLKMRAGFYFYDGQRRGFETFVKIKDLTPNRIQEDSFISLENIGEDFFKQS